MQLDGKVAVITGGSSGIGFAIAQEFIHQKAHVILFARDEESLRNATRTYVVI